MSLSGILRYVSSVALLGAAFCVPGSATSILFEGANGNLAGSANFILIGNTLTIEVKNEANSSATAPADVLIGIFFDLAGNPVTNLQSIAVDANSSIVNCVGSCGAGTLVDTNVNSFNGGWQYLSGISNGSTGAYGAGTAGYGIFNGTQTGGGGGCAGNQQFCFGLIPTAGTTSHPQLTGNQFIKSGIVITLTLQSVPVDFDIREAVSNLRLQYGTSLTEPYIDEFEEYPSEEEEQPQVPEPSTYALMGIGLAAMGVLRKRASGGR